jgi:hypothetical protein
MVNLPYGIIFYSELTGTERGAVSRKKQAIPPARAFSLTYHMGVCHEQLHLGIQTIRC